MLKTLVISHSEVFFSGLKKILAEDNLILSEEKDLGIKLVENIKKFKPSIIILHQSYFEFLDETFIKYLNAHKESIKFLVVGAKNKNNVDYYIKQSANGYLYEDSDIKILHKAYTAIKEGKFYFPDEVTQDLLKKISDNQKPLTNKENELIKFIADGYSSKEIGVKIGCGTNTVNVHKFNIKLKLNIKSNSELIRYCRSLATS